MGRGGTLGTENLFQVSESGSGLHVFASVPGRAIRQQRADAATGNSRCRNVLVQIVPAQRSAVEAQANRFQGFVAGTTQQFESFGGKADLATNVFQLLSVVFLTIL